MLIGLILIILLFAVYVLFGISDFHFHRKPKAGAIRVACVGDSITNGTMIPGSLFRAYPAQLQRRLGERYHVEAFGLPGRAMQASAYKPYSAEKEYRRSLTFHPDIVIIMLGTNDTREQCWHSEERFAVESRELIQSYLSLESCPKVILCTPPWQRDAANPIQRITNDTFEARLVPISEILRAIGGELNLPVLDLHTEFFERAELYCYDGVHPNVRGAALIAEKVYEEIAKITK